MMGLGLRELLHYGPWKHTALHIERVRPGSATLDFIPQSHRHACCNNAHTRYTLLPQANKPADAHRDLGVCNVALN